MTQELPEIDCEGTKELVCPYCGHEFSDSWEIGDGDGDKYECGECDKKFLYLTEITRTFTSRTADCLNGGDHNFSIWNHHPNLGDYRWCRNCDKKEVKT